LLKIEGKTGGKLIKVWDKRWSKLPKVIKWFAILTILRLFVTFAMKKLEVLLILAEKFRIWLYWSKS
jgi:hypothetical protein